MKTVEIKGVVFGEGSPKICLPVFGKTEAEILENFDDLNSIDFDLVEFRADHFEFAHDFSKVRLLLGKIREKYDKPLLFTFRTLDEGGACHMSGDKYYEMNRAVIESGSADLIDVELSGDPVQIKSLIEFAKEKNTKVIMSSHDFLKTPSKEEIVNRLVKMQGYDADITKIAVMPQREEDVLTLLSAALEMKKHCSDRPYIAISMGAMGIVSRLSGELFGSCMTFAAAGQASAPGQIMAKDMRNILNLLKL